MRCRRARKMISLYVDDELGMDKKKTLDAHLHTCAACGKELKQMQALHELFASARQFPAPYGFATRVLGNLEENEAPRVRSIFSFRPIFLRAAQVIVALVVTTIGIISGSLLLAERSNPAGPTAVREGFSLDLFQATPPGSIGGIYAEIMRPDHEK